MAKPKKEGKYLNCYIQKEIHDKLEETCKVTGQSKTIAVERAIEMYAEKMKKC